MFKNCMLIFVDLGYVQVKADEGRWLIWIKVRKAFQGIQRIHVA